MGSKHLIYLALISIVVILTSCDTGKEEHYNKIHNYFNKKHKYKIGSEINKIVVVGEGMICGSCEIAFADLALEHLSDSSIYLVTAVGNVVDIRKYLKLKENCFFDWQLNTMEYPEFESARVIYLQNNSIDTVISLNAKEIKQQLDFFQNNTQAK